jgi:hypothetical protein
MVSNNQSNQTTDTSDSSEKAFIRGLTQDEKLERKELFEELELLKLRKSVSAEIERFASEISSDEFKNKKSSFKKFWLKNEKNLPLLYKLALVISNIQCSAAFIERYDFIR